MLSCQSRYFYQLRTWAFSFVLKRETPGTSLYSLRAGYHGYADNWLQRFFDEETIRLTSFFMDQQPFFHEEHVMASYFLTWIRKPFFRVRASLKCFFLYGSVDSFASCALELSFFLWCTRRVVIFLHGSDEHFLAGYISSQL